MGTEIAEREVVPICQAMLRMDSSGPPRYEKDVADYVASKLGEVGIRTQVFDSAPMRRSVLARVGGAKSGTGGLLLHAHLDVVPAVASEWTLPPFSGALRDGYLWGRGAIDMKDTVAVFLAVARHLARTNTIPPRDLLFAFVADEESGGQYGSHWLVENHAESFRGIRYAIGEGGGVSMYVDDAHTFYPIECAQRGQAWLRLQAEGRAGHGSSPNNENAVTRIAQAVARIGSHKFAPRLIDSVRELAHSIADIKHIPFDDDNIDASIDALGPGARSLLRVITRNSANPTELRAGYKVNVIPARATATIDGRFLPGGEDELLDEIDKMLPTGVTREFVHHDIAMETAFRGDLVEAMCRSLVLEDHTAVPVPYCNPGGTDAKAFSTLGIDCYGFKALKLPRGLDYGKLFHGIDERVPVDALRFSVRAVCRMIMKIGVS